MYNKDTIFPVLDTALSTVGILRAAGYDAHVVGGALRVLGIGGETSDVDVAVLCTPEEAPSLHNDTSILLGFMDYQLCHWSGYTETVGFLADWRSSKAPINIIAYDINYYETASGLVKRFDLNINQFEPIACHSDGIINQYFDGHNVKVNPERDHDYQTDRLADRIKRFSSIYPDFNWSNLDAAS